VLAVAGDDIGRIDFRVVRHAIDDSFALRERPRLHLRFLYIESPRAGEGIHLRIARGRKDEDENKKTDAFHCGDIIQARYELKANGTNPPKRGMFRLNTGRIAAAVKS